LSLEFKLWRRGIEVIGRLAKDEKSFQKLTHIAWEKNLSLSDVISELIHFSIENPEIRRSFLNHLGE
jgi:hypothetical protein